MHDGIAEKIADRPFQTRPVDPDGLVWYLDSDRCVALASERIQVTNDGCDKLGQAVTQIQAARQFTFEEIATFKASF